MFTKALIPDEFTPFFDEGLQFAANKGFDHVELHTAWGTPVEYLTDTDVAKVKKHLKRFNMKLTNLGSSLFLVCPIEEGYATAPLPGYPTCMGKSIDEHKESMKRTAEIAHELGTPRLRCHGFQYPKNADPKITDETLNRVIEEYIKIAELAREYDVTMLLENCPHTFVATGSICLKVVKAIDSPYVRMMWDPANSLSAQTRPDRAARLSEKYRHSDLFEELVNGLPYIQHMHLKDYHPRTLPDGTPGLDLVTFGTGGFMPQRKFIKYMLENDYRYTASLEAESFFVDALLSVDTFNNIIENEWLAIDKMAAGDLEDF